MEGRGQYCVKKSKTILAVVFSNFSDQNCVINEFADQFTNTSRAFPVCTLYAHLPGDT